MFTVYILFSESLNRYYVGHTGDLKDRLIRHNQGRSKSTKSGIPWKIMYTEAYQTKPEAYQREMEIKKRNQEYILND